jgi:hypothetical protein
MRWTIPEGADTSTGPWASTWCADPVGRLIRPRPAGSGQLELERTEARAPGPAPADAEREG